ncbi:MAG: TolC family protein [Myxococcaceae bacterium]
MGVRALRGALLAWTWALLPAAGLAEDRVPSGTLTLEEAVQTALSRNPDLRGRRSLAGADRADAWSARGRLLPSVSIAGAYADVTSPEKLSLAGVVGGAGSGGTAAQPISISGVNVGLGLVTASQPLLGLLHLSYEYASASERADASVDGVRTLEGQVREQVESALLALLEARAERNIAQGSYEQLQAQVQVTEAKLVDKVLTRGDLLRVKVALANADQDRMQADVQEQISRASLLTLMGLSADQEGVDFAEPVELERLPVPVDASQAQAEALAQRSEVHAVSKESQAAHDGRVSSELKLLPEVNATAAYLRVQGLSGIPPNYYVLGFTLNWQLWDWGTTYYQARAASEREAAADAKVDSVRAQVRLDVLRRMAEERAAAHAVQVAQQTIEEAEEAFRVTAAMAQAGAATTTDVLDAQSALTQSKLHAVRARYQELRARSALSRALGG